jgi:hypothetical protein
LIDRSRHARSQEELSQAHKQLGRLYKQMLEAQGIRIRLRTTAGAMISETSE